MFHGAITLLGWNGARTECVEPTDVVVAVTAVLDDGLARSEPVHESRSRSAAFWSLLPFVQQRLGTYTSRLEMAHFVAPMSVGVH